MSIGDILQVHWYPAVTVRGACLERPHNELLCGMTDDMVQRFGCKADSYLPGQEMAVF